MEPAQHGDTGARPVLPATGAGLVPGVSDHRPRLVYNALPLSRSGGGVSTYIRELLDALPDAVDASLAAAVSQDAADLLPARVEALVQPESEGVRRALRGLRGFGPADLVHGLDVDLPF